MDKVKAESCENAGRLPFGLPSVNKNKEVGNANYLWISYFYSYLNEHGRAGFVMASSATDSQGMAVVISQEQNEIQTFKKWDLDIKYHRAKMEKRELDKEFKDSSNPLRVVFVCAMWLTGYDVKCLSCLYLDKPLKAHTLMQTIARANRVNEGKSNGLIIDYIGIVKSNFS